MNGAFVGGVVLPGPAGGLMTFWPWLDRSPASVAGRWLPRERRTQNLVFLLISLAILAFMAIGMFMRGPSWEFFWPWQPWPEIPGGGSEHGDSEPTLRIRAIDRPVLALIGVVLVGATAFFAYSDRQHDYKWYQAEFRSRVAEKFGAERAATVTTGLQQVWMPGLQRADRCTTCHQATAWKGFEDAEEPWRTHPPRS